MLALDYVLSKISGMGSSEYCLPCTVLNSLVARKAKSYLTGFNFYVVHFGVSKGIKPGIFFKLTAVK